MGFLDYLDEYEDKLKKSTKKKIVKEVEETKKVVKKKPVKKFKIKPKKIIKSPVNEARGHAINILDGLPDQPDTFKKEIATDQERQQIIEESQMTRPEDFNLNTVAGHASALL